VDRIDWRTEAIAATCLDLHEGHDVLTPHDEVDVAMSAAESVCYQLPSLASQPAPRNPLAQQSERLSLFRHALSVARVPARRVTQSTRASY